MLCHDESLVDAMMANFRRMEEEMERTMENLVGIMVKQRCVVNQPTGVEGQ